MLHRSRTPPRASLELGRVSRLPASTPPRRATSLAPLPVPLVATFGASAGEAIASRCSSTARRCPCASSKRRFVQANLLATTWIAKAACATSCLAVRRRSANRSHSCCERTGAAQSLACISINNDKQHGVRMAQSPVRCRWPTTTRASASPCSSPDDPAAKAIAAKSARWAKATLIASSRLGTAPSTCNAAPARNGRSP